MIDDPISQASPTKPAPLPPTPALRNGHVAEPFAPLQGRAAAIKDEPGETAEEWEPVLPAPEEPPEAAQVRHPKHGGAAQRWVYRDGAGAPLFAVVRFKRIEGGKEVLPYCYGRRAWTDAKGKQHDRTGWHFKAPPSPRPLYGLDWLATRPDAPVLLVEGEKTADNAAKLFRSMVAMTSQGGSNAAGNTDWTKLSGRYVTVWPDHDGPGAKYAREATKLALRAGAASVRIVQVPDGFPQGWDVADELPDSVTEATLAELITGAVPFAEPTQFPHGFRMTKRGLFFLREPNETNPNPEPVFVAAPFEVVGLTRTGDGEEWGVLLRWNDGDGRPHQWAIPRRLVHDQGNSIAAELENNGLECGSDASAHSLLKRFVAGVKVGRRLRCVSRTGWHKAEAGPVFVLPGGEAFGRDAADVILQSEHAGAGAAFRSAGTLADWQREIAACAVGNDRMALFIAAAFAGPLLDLMETASGGVHLVGTSQTGKSAMAQAAASVWGRASGDALMRTWRATANGLEAAAAETSETLLILDEIGQANSNDVADVVYTLGNNTGKQRADRAGAMRAARTWRVLFLSTGEISLATKMAEAGKRPAVGLEVRLVNLPADAGVGLGVFQQLHGQATGAALADHLRSASQTYYGTASRGFLKRLADDRSKNPETLRDTLKELCDVFLNKHVPADAAGQVRSVAARFALIAAAGELARDYGVLPWPEGEALRAAGACFGVWLADRGGAGTGEDTAMLAQVRAFIEANGDARFTPLLHRPNDDDTPPEGMRTVNRVGWRRRVNAGDGQEYLILPEVWKNEVCKGIDPNRTAKLLAERGLLTKGDGKNLASNIRVPGEGVCRVYRVSGALLGGADE